MDPQVGLQWTFSSTILGSHLVIPIVGVRDPACVAGEDVQWCREQVQLSMSSQESIVDVIHTSAQRAGLRRQQLQGHVLQQPHVASLESLPHSSRGYKNQKQTICANQRLWADIVDSEALLAE